MTAKASSVQGTSGPEKTIDGSGLNASDQHSMDLKDMWMSTGAKPHWIQYEFDKVYKVHELWVWNSNQIIESFLGFGAKTVKIEYSTDGTTAWTELAGVPEFSKATGSPDYTANTTVSFGGVEAKFVKLTITANWSTGGVIPQTSLSEVRFFYVPVQARAPQPAAAATGVNVDTDLNWRPGRGATSHKVYFGTDKDAVANGTASADKGKVTDHSFDAGSLLYGTTYYWRVDEVGDATYPGEVWSFTTREFATVDDFESYTDDEGSRIYETWVDGWTNNTGSVVGHLQAPFAETAIVHGGKQSMPMDYNNAKTPFYSEAEREFTPVENWTLGGATDVALWFRGSPVRYVDKGNGAFTVGASGHDIWDNADDFRFVYKSLNGNGSVTVKVESLVNTNAWAKAGVMIRESLNAGSTMAYMIISWSSGASFGWRQVADAGCGSQTQAGITAPQWVKLTRTGNAFTAQYSADGKAWTDIKNASGQVVSTTINMAANVYIGLCTTSHNSAATTTAQYSGAATTGNVTGQWQQVWIGDDVDRTNSPAGLYLVVQDSASKSKVVTHPDPAATTISAWQQWRIPLTEFTSAGVKMTAVKKLTIGVGDKNSPKAGGAGTLYIDDIGFGKPAQ